MSKTEPKRLVMTGAMRVRLGKVIILSFAAGCCLLSVLSGAPASSADIFSPPPAISIPQPEFSPSNAQTEDGKLIPVE